MTYTASYTFKEELANAITHATGFLLSIAGLVWLVVLSVRDGDPVGVAGMSIYGGALILMYLASTLYHSIPGERIKHWLKVIDHSAIYLLIAGTYTAISVGFMRGTFGYSILGVIWALALAGIIFKIFFVQKFKKLSISIYLLMGWLSVIAMPSLIKAMPTGGLIWLVSGGLLYSLGVIFYANKKIPFNHAIWHIFVLAASACHFVAIFTGV